MCEKVNCSNQISKVMLHPISCPNCRYKFDILLGADSYIELFCDKCNTFFYVCNKATISKGNVTEQNYFDHEDRSLNRKAYFLVSCMTYEDDYLEFHLGEHSYAEFKCPHCGAYAAVKTTSKSYKYMPPKYIMKGRYRNRIC